MKQSGVIGEKELMRRLNSLGSQGKRNKIVRPAINEAASKINKKAKALVIEETGLLRKSIGVKRATKRGVVFAVVGPRHGFKREVERTLPSGDRASVLANPTKYAHLVEFGTRHSPPHPFLRPAHDGTPSESIIRRRMTKELRRQAVKK